MRRVTEPSDQPMPEPRKPADPAPGTPPDSPPDTPAPAQKEAAQKSAHSEPTQKSATSEPSQLSPLPGSPQSGPPGSPPGETPQRSWILPPDATFKPARPATGAPASPAPESPAAGTKPSIADPAARSEAPPHGDRSGLSPPDDQSETDDRPWFRRAWPWVVIFLAALALRGVYLEQIRAIPFFDSLVGDAASYDAWAQNIAGGDWIGDETYYQAPAYPYFLGLIYTLLGRDLLLARVVQAVLGALSCLLLGFAGKRFFGRSAGLVAAGILAIYPPAVFFDGLIQKTSLALFWMCLLLWLLGLQLHRPRGWRWLLVGMVLGLFALTRENALVLALVVLGWALLNFRNAPWRQKRNWAAAVVAGLLIVFYPVAFRNYCVGGVWATTTVQAGPNFYIGNHPGATGLYKPLVRGHESPPFERADAKLLAEQATGETLSDLEVSRFWLNKAWDYIRTQPHDWLELMGRKLLLTVNHYEITDTEGFNVYRDFAWALQLIALLIGFGVIAPLAAAGAVLTLHRWRQVGVLHVMTAAMILAIAAFYVFARYRFPLVPLFILFAAAGAAETVRRVQVRRYGVLIVAGLVGLVAAIASNRPMVAEERLDAMAYSSVGVALAQQGNIEASKRFFAIAIEESPQAPEPYFNFGRACLLQGDYGAAISYLRKAQQLDPGLIEVDYQLALALEADGNPPAALRHYRAALARNPLDHHAAAAIERLAPKVEPLPGE